MLSSARNNILLGDNAKLTQAVCITKSQLTAVYAEAYLYFHNILLSKLSFGHLLTYSETLVEICTL